MSRKKHKARLFYSLNELLGEMCSYEDNYFLKRKELIIRYWKKIWKRHISKHGNTPYIIKCGVCSGSERKWEIKTGKFKISKRYDKNYKVNIEF